MEKDKADVDMASEEGGRESVPRGSSEGEGEEGRRGDTPGPLPQYQYDRVSGAAGWRHQDRLHSSLD